MAACQIMGCTNEPERTLGRERIIQALKKENLELNAKSKLTKVKICKDHYKKLKKHLKKTDKIERLRWNI